MESGGKIPNMYFIIYAAKYSWKKGGNVFSFFGCESCDYLGKFYLEFINITNYIFIF